MMTKEVFEQCCWRCPQYKQFEGEYWGVQREYCEETMMHEDVHASKGFFFLSHKGSGPRDAFNPDFHYPSNCHFELEIALLKEKSDETQS